jgi:CheY-like chemotaxis protein
MISGHRRTILLVDDNEDVRELLTCVLGSAGYDVMTAADGEEALNRLRHATECGLILLELHMPGLDGRGFRAKQVEHERWGQIPVVLLSAAPNALAVAADLGVSDGLRKPLDLNDLLNRVDRYYRPAQAAA